MSRNCGNPLLRDWVKEWMEHAQRNNSKSYYTFKKVKQVKTELREQDILIFVFFYSIKNRLMILWTSV